MGRRETDNVLGKARQVYEMALLGLADLKGPDPKRRIPGLWNAVTFGRNVSFVIQNLKHIPGIGEVAFRDWYGPRQEAMRLDPLMQYFSKLRSVIEKEGGPETGVEMLTTSLNSADLAPLMANPPPGARGFFIVDRLGGSGWEVETADGSIERYYVALPESVLISWSLTLPNPPSTHLGQPIEDQSAHHLCTLFLAYIGGFLAEAEAHFGRQRRLD